MRKLIPIIMAALLSASPVIAGTTGLGASPFALGGTFPHTSANAMANAIDDNAGDIAELVTLSGKAADSTHLGTFTGSTIPDSSTIYAALQAIETAYEATLPVAEAYDQLGYENDYGAVTKHDLQAKLETMGGSGDITSVWTCTSGACTKLSQAPIQFVDGDTTPDVSAGNVFYTNNTAPTTYVDFDTSLADGQLIWIIVHDGGTPGDASNSTFSVSGSGLVGIGTAPYVARVGDLIKGIYSTVTGQWHLSYFPSSIGTFSLQEGVVWADGDGTGSIAWAFATSAARTVTIPGDANITLSYTVASGTSALGTDEIASGACASVVTTAATGVATTDVIDWGFNTDPTAITGYASSANGMLTILAYPTSGNVNYKVCNNTAGAVTPGAMTLNWRVER